MIHTVSLEVAKKLKEAGWEKETECYHVKQLDLLIELPFYFREFLMIIKVDAR